MVGYQKRNAAFLYWRVTLFRTIAAILAMACLSTAQQSQPALQITSPADGSVVNPGQAVSVSVGSPANLSFKQVFVMGEGAIDTTNIATSVPAQFSMLIPNNMQIGRHLLTAWGTTGAGQMVASIPLTIDVERSDLPVRLRADPDRVIFQSQGQQESLRISATFSDGSFLAVTQSSNLTFTSSDSKIATVDSNGTVTGVTKGIASITATYTLGTQSVHFSVFVTVPPPVLTSSPPALSFNNQNVGTRSAAQTLTLTNVSNNQSLKVGPVAAAGDFSETDNCATSSPIAVGGMCTVNVTFSPAAAGARTGTVYVADGMDIVPLGIPLSGTGVAVPSITSLSPTSGPVETSVTITGANFGNTQGTSTVTFNGTSATPTNWSVTSIVAPVPTGATTGNVVVTVGGVASNGVTFTVGNAPVAYVQGNSVDSQTSQTTFTLTTVSSGIAIMSNAHDLLVGADTTDAFTNGAGDAYTTRILTNDILEDEEVKTTGSYSATASIGTDAPPNGQVIHYVIQMIAFRAAH